MNLPPAAPAPSRWALIFAFAAIYLIWGSTYLAIRVAVATFPPFLMGAIRFLIAGSALLLILRLRGVPWPARRQWRDHAIAGTLLLLGGNGIVGWAEQKVASGLTTLILGASPFIMVIMEWLRPGGSRPRPATLAGLTLGIVGLVVLLGPGAIPAGYQPPLFDVLALLFASTCWWAGSLYSKHRGGGLTPLMGVAVQLLAASLACALFGLATGEGPRWSLAAISGQSWLALGYLILAGSLVAYPVYIWLLGHSTPARVSTYAYVNPVIAVILGWAILGEPLTSRMALAAAIIIAAVAIITIERTRSRNAG